MEKKSLFSFNRFFRATPSHALLFCLILGVMMMKADAQAPSSFAGQTLLVDVTGGTYPPFASSGYFLLLPAVSGSDYQIVGIYGIEDTSGTYAYSGSGASGTAQMDDNQAGSLENVMTFDTPTSGSYEVSSARYATSQTGNFEMFSAPVPAALLGKRFTCSIEDGLHPYANVGTFIFEAATSGRSYTITGDGTNTPTSSGTYSYSKINGNTGDLQMSDSVLGVETAYIAFSSATNGGFAIKSPSTGGFQIGHFVATDTGSLEVTIAPYAAITNGAQWQVDGGALQASGATVTNLPVGNHIVSFTTISNWTTPTNQTVAVLANAPARAVGTYGVPTGALQVLIRPAQANKAGAKWQVQGGDFLASGAIIAGLPPGAQTVSFKTIPGWLSPSNQTVTISVDQTNILAVFYFDATPPTLSIVSPTANQRWSNSIFTATGTAKDNVQVSNVFYQLNGSGWTPATPGNTNWTNWTATLTPLKSTNLFQAYSVDTSGNKSPTNKVSFLYIPSATLTVQTNGIGGITPVDNGKLLAIGTNYTLTAAPGNNWLFSNWVGGTTLPYSVLSTSSNYTFTMQSNLVLQANFVTNPFLAVAGVYNGLFYPTNGVTEASSGFISVAIASNSTGAYTAKLLLDGGSNSFSGSFDLTGTARTNLARSGKTPVSVTLILDLNPADALMGGSVSNAAAGWNSVIQADRAVFSTTANPATNYAGQFTLLLPPDANAPVASPGGYGYAAITNTLGGISTLGGALADGTPFLWSVPIARNGGVPLYQSLYSGKGSLLGWIYFTNEPPQNVSTNSSVSWIKPSVPNTLYPSGFTNLDRSARLALHEHGRRRARRC